LDGLGRIRVANLAIHFGTQLLQLLDTELHPLSSVAIVTFFSPPRFVSNRHVRYTAGQRLHRALAVGVGSGRNEQGEFARALGHPILDGLKKIAAAKGPIGDNEDPGHRDYLQVGSATEGTPKGAALSRE
jgi:hypothetical protein